MIICQPTMGISTTSYSRWQAFLLELQAVVKTHEGIP